MEENIKKVEEIVCSIWDDVGCDVYLGKEERDALNELIDNYKNLKEELKREKSWRIRVEQENEDICHEVNTKYVRKSIAVPKYEIEKLKKENEINIDKMRPYRHQGPFDFGVLNGIDECCRKLLEDK